jgi:hypothetical protein
MEEKIPGNIHPQRMLVADKAVALLAALDKKQDILAQIVRGLNYDARTLF